MNADLRIVHGVKAMGAPLPASVVTLGTFDGVHRGHQTLIDSAVREAHARGVEAIAYTFDPHPAKILAPRMAPRTLTSISERARLICARGVDRIVVEPFDRAFADLSADAWVDDWLVGVLRPVHVVVGFNFSYGRGRGGDPRHLIAAGARHGFSVDIVDAVSIEGGLCSSTRVRELLLEGNVEGARLLLARPFGLTGSVVKGEGRGRTIGVPTANLRPDHELLPAAGVYATRVFLDSDSGEGSEPGHPAVTNIGLRPTFGGSHVTIESHLLDFSGDLYERSLRVELIQRLRDELRFSGPDALVRQITEDIANARHVLGAHRA